MRSLLIIAFCFGVVAAAEQPLPDVAHPGLAPLFDAAGPNGRVKLWVLMNKDKGHASGLELDTALAELERNYDPHAIRRRALRRTRPGLFDVDDLPLPESWVDQVRASGAQVVVESRWISGVSVLATRAQLFELAQLPFVESLRPVARSARRDRLDRPEPRAAPSPTGTYGESEAQLQQINLIAFHEQGYTGQGVRVGVLDTGFRRTHQAFNDPAHGLSVIAEWDFVNDDPDTAPEPGEPANQHEHGTAILGAIGAYQPGVLIGSAPDASYILAKVEDVLSEYALEEDWFAAGLEYIEQSGGDLATSSLTIYNWYTQEQMDGQTSVMAQAVNVATDNGLHVCQGAGNSGHDGDPSTSTLIPPADAFKVITVGSVDINGVEAWFTSDGPTADGRVKPEIMARGVNTRTVSVWVDDQTDGYDGASMATPLVCGAVACLLQAHPDWNVDQLRTHLFLHGDFYETYGRTDPFFVEGFGIIDVLAADTEDCNGNGVDDPTDLASATSGDCNANAVPDECDLEALTSRDDAADGLPDECTECVDGPACPTEVPGLRLAKQDPNLVLTWDAATNVGEYTVRRDEQAPAAGITEIGRVPSSWRIWTDSNALIDPPDIAYYVVRAVTLGGVVGP